MILLLLKQTFWYSNTGIQYISTNYPLARKQASSITSLHKQQRTYLMPRYKTPLFIQTFCLLFRASLSARQHLTRPSWPLHLPQMSSQKKSQIFLSAPPVSNSGVQGITKPRHIYILSLMTPQFALSSHSNGIKRSLGSCQFPDDRKLAIVVPVWKRSKKDDLDSYESVSLTSVPGKILEKEMMVGVTENTWKTNLSLVKANTSSWLENPMELNVLWWRGHTFR